MKSSSAEFSIEVSDLVVHRGRTKILHGLSCSLPRGSITGLLGPSGCGKTTLMRSLLGVQRITSGSAASWDCPSATHTFGHKPELSQFSDPMSFRLPNKTGDPMSFR